jgi:hypothetical protein
MRITGTSATAMIVSAGSPVSSQAEFWVRPNTSTANVS